MKVTLLVWGATLGIVLMVSGRSLDQMLLAFKVMLFGAFFGFIGGKVSIAIEKYRDANISPLRRRCK